MFNRIKKAFQREPRVSESSLSHQAPERVSEWAATRGMSFSSGLGNTLSMAGKVGGRTWRMELGKPSRDYVVGEELRARAELGVLDDVGALIISRPLKDALERRAYSMITDTLETTAEARLPEEMRWLAMYDEVSWEGPPPAFFTHYAVHAGKREHALAWVDDPLVKQLLARLQPAALPAVPFMIVLLRGKCYLRMQYLPAETSTLDQATDLFVGACESALEAFRN
jgi:hypothetical protein